MRSALAVTILLFFSVCAFGQANGSINGTVTDTSGSAIPNATVTATMIGTGVVRSVQSNSEGVYKILNIQPGEYRVEVKADGFEPSMVPDVVLQVGDERGVNFKMKIGSVNETVDINTQANTIETTTAVMGGVVAQQVIDSLPLNGRGFQDLAVTQANVTVSTASNRNANVGYGQKISVAGLRPTSSSYSLDGQDINNMFNDLSNVSGSAAGIDSVQEFKVITNPYSAEYGRTGAGEIQIVTKSGTNAFHGSAYDFLRNNVFDSRNYFDPASGPPPFRRNQFGASIGGPIFKNKTFFFANYEGLRQALATTYVYTLPDANAHNGFLPTGPGGSLVHVGVAANTAPYLALFPLPQTLIGQGLGFYSFATTAPTNDDFILGRIDHHFSPNESLWVRYSGDKGSSVLPNDILISINTQTNSDYAAVGLTSVLSPHIVNSGMIAYNRSVSLQYDTPSALLTDPSLLVLTSNRDQFGPLYAGIAVGGLSVVGNNSAVVLTDAWLNTYQLRDDITFDKGRQTIKAGVNLEKQQPNVFNGLAAGGQFTFQNIQGFLQGIGTQFNSVLPNSLLSFAYTQWLTGVYLQDDIRINSKLTANAGIRYEPASVPTERHGNLANCPNYLQPNLPLSDCTTASPYYYNPSMKNFAPRLGLSWSPTPDMVVRAGGGIFFDQLLAAVWRAPATQTPPYYARGTILSTALPPGTPIDFPNAFFTQSSFLHGVLDANPIQKHMEQPTTYQYTLNVQQQMGSNRVFSLAYVGSVGRHLIRVIDYNGSRIPTGFEPNGYPFWTSLASNPARNPAFGQIKTRVADDNSNYNSLSASFEQKYSSGLIYKAAYLYGKSLDDGSMIVGGTEYTNEAQFPYRYPFLPTKDEYGPSAYDIRHNFVANAVYPLPWHLGGRRAAQNGFVNQIASGWSVSGLAKLSSGVPFNLSGSISSSQRTCTTFPCLDTLPPDITTTPLQKSSRNPSAYFNLNAFQLPPVGHLGHVSRHMVSGPAIVAYDMSVAKDLSFGRDFHGIRGQFRVDSFNIFNRANFGLPNGTLYLQQGTAAAPTFSQNPAAGKITNTSTNPRQFQFAFRILF